MVIKRGLVIGAAAAEEPQGLLVDEVGVDSELADHDDVYWYPDNNSLAAMLPGDWYSALELRGPQYKYVHGWEGAASSPPGSQAIVAVPEFGMNAVRWGSQYYSSPDHIDDHATIQSWNKYVEHDTRSSSAAIALGTTPIPQGYFRWMFMVEADAADGFQESGMKLSGINHETGGYCILWYAPPGTAGAAADQVRLVRYMNSVTHGGENGHPDGFLDTTTFLTLGQWYGLEMFYKMNSDAATSDGELRIWVDDVLVFERTGIKWANTMPVNEVTMLESFNIHSLRGQLYHGGTLLAPSTQIHHRQFGFCFANRRIGRANTV
jgi:hypothetical protein